MNRGANHCIWQADDWPSWCYDRSVLTAPLTEVRRAQGVLLGRLADVGLALRDQASLAALTADVVKASEIEGELLNAQSARSSIARRLGVDIRVVAPTDRHVEGVVDRVLDGTRWLSRFLRALRRAIASAQSTLDAVLVKAHFWQRWAGTPLNARQAKLLKRKTPHPRTISRPAR